MNKRSLIGRAIESILLLLAFCRAGEATAVTYVHVANNSGLQAVSTASADFVVRDGYAAVGDAPALMFIPSTSACSISGGDGGSQVPSANSKCWLAVFDGPVDWREFGGTYPFVLHVSATGSDSTGSAYCLSTAPCATVQHAVDVAAKLDFKNQNNWVYIDGTFTGAGFSASGPYSNVSGNGISGQYLRVIGVNGASAVTLNAADATAPYNIGVSNGAQVFVQAVTLSVSSGHYGIFSQNPGTIVEVGNNVACSGATGPVSCLYAEANALIEVPSGQTLKIQGTFDRPLHANSGAYVEQDPSLGGTIDCGTGLSVSSGGAFAAASVHGHLLWSTTTLTGCSSVTGDLVRADSGGLVTVTSGAVAPPGNGYVRIFGEGSGIWMQNGTPPWAPALGTCNNAALATGATNYDFVVNFNNPNSSCGISFGKPSNATAYFAGYPVCIVATVTEGSGPTVGFSSLSNSGVTVVPSTAFASGQALHVHCSPNNGG